MDLPDYEDKVIAELVANLTASVEVRAYPDDYPDYVAQLKHPGGAILTVFQGTFWNPPEGNPAETLTQEAVYTWQFTVIQKSLKRQKNAHGIYDILEEIRTILSGFTPAGFNDAGVLFPVDQGFLEKRKGFYVYQITMGHTLEESEE